MCLDSLSLGGIEVKCVEACTCSVPISESCLSAMEQLSGLLKVAIGIVHWQNSFRQ